MKIHSVWEKLLGQQKEQEEEFKYVTIGCGTSVSDLYNNADALRYTSTSFSQMQKPLERPLERPLPPLTLAALSGEAGRASLDELANLWRARWGDKWVKREEIDGDFFEVAALRLLSGSRLETHSLSDGVTVYRLL